MGVKLKNKIKCKCPKKKSKEPISFKQSKEIDFHGRCF
jgi:hypothetical protein